MKFLLTGATGQVGRRLRPLLAAMGDVAAPGRGDFDLARPEALRATVSAIKPDVIVNPGAYTAVERAEDEEVLATTVNGAAVGVLAQEAARLGAALLHFSTDYVFDGASGVPYDEDAATGPIGAYGRSKLAGEKAIQASGAAALTFRTSWIYDVEGTNFVNTMLRLGTERDEIGVVADQHGAPTSADVIAEAVAAILSQAGGDTAGLCRAKGGIVNLCCSGATTWHGFAEAIFSGARRRGMVLRVRGVKPIATADYGTKVNRPANSRLDLGRLRARFGIVPADWHAALDAVLDAKIGPARGPK